MLLLSSAGALAQEYCVACTGPDVLYRCIIDGAQPGSTPSLPMLCISSLAKDGAHATCAVKRNIGVIDCNGPVKHVSAMPGASPAPAAGAATATAPSKAEAAAGQAKSDGQPKGDPKTVAEMLQRAKESNDKSWEKTNAQIQSNNEKIGGFFKKSWTCMASLFSRCSE